MLWITEDARLVCHHGGIVNVEPTQTLVTISGRRVLVEDNPASRTIAGCPFTGPMIKPCTNTLAVKEGYSNFVRMGGRRVCLDSVTGLTDGSPPGTVKYVVRVPGQNLVREGG
jgi:hypothetical protein